MPILDEFILPSEKEIEAVIKKSSSTTCLLDPAPTFLVKQNLDSLIHIFSNIVCSSLSSSLVPHEFKSAVVTPILKKATLDCEILQNYRPISNLPFLAKVLEKVVAARLNNHLEQYHLHEVHQSAYKSHHSTETCLVKVQSDILSAIDKKQLSILVLLDLSSAFDTVDHTLLLRRMESRLGIRGKVLQWFKSYLSGRDQCVKVDSECSQPVPLSCGVPQGSVLGPILFTIYTLPLGDIIRHHGLNYHFYADDTQIYVSIEPNEQAETEALEQCISDMRQWMLVNLLKLNDSKTEVLLIGSNQQRAKCSLSSITVGNSSVCIKSSARNLGVIFDDSLSMDLQVKSLCKAMYFYLYNISKIRKCLTKEATVRLVHALISSRLDMCNSLLCGLPSVLLNKLQTVQNSAARLIVGVRKSHHITPILIQLHWLPVRQRIDYKILLLTYCALNNLAPAYLRDLLCYYQPSRTLRSSCQNLLVEPKFRLSSCGSRAFVYAAPRLWNSLPLDIRCASSLNCFKSLLKTHLFKIAFSGK